jgi:hypothetical protein
VETRNVIFNNLGADTEQGFLGADTWVDDIDKNKRKTMQLSKMRMFED